MLTDKQRAFCEFIAHGLTQGESARRAGYSDKTADSTASRLMAHPDVKHHIEELRAQRLIDRYKRADASPMIKADPLAYLRSVWTDENEDPKLRIDAAKAAMPYVHGRIAPAGKKEDKAQAAKATASSGSKFGTLDNQLNKPRPS